MALKRKRSSPTFNSPFSDATTTSDTSSSPLPFFYAQSKPIETLYHKPTWSFPTYESDDTHDNYTSSRHLNSRTRKRHRDDRPDEKSVFANTISRLYEAQRNLQKPEPVFAQPAAIVKMEEPVQKSTLHSFWKIEGAAPPATVPMAIDSASNTIPSSGLKCEDCERPLLPDDAMDLGEEYLQRESACSSCGRQVCDRCAVLGNARVCLGCAS